MLTAVRTGDLFYSLSDGRAVLLKPLERPASLLPVRLDVVPDEDADGCTGIASDLTYGAVGTEAGGSL
jgi:hypothetical protein